MKVKCVLCDQINTIDDDSMQAKRLRNRPIHTYMCDACYVRIEEKTNMRLATGNFHLYRDKKTEDEW
ncbi:YlaI family protein [Cytobacillus sp. IB215665]|uniref:YlaI family protein n=1 Tax=Cytobacillus sp. IB215665 TaxID=3097357 RepID=UPI002A0D2C0F|nr:YlaI family protein [Cytobacillus sp. IB215665]MDX8364917.1 YlaI family protein [Cytobacillus sp. IB215665]